MIKRTFDIFISFITLVLSTPLFILIGLLIKVDSKGPIFFIQNRKGLNGNDFKIFKFRTMYQRSEIQGKLTVGSDPRITNFGKLLRRSKIDELPQLLNVLIGDMSLVGPRPEVEEFFNYYPEDIQKVILSVRPGITDNASVELINEAELLSQYVDSQKAYIEEILPRKQELYIKYIKERNFCGDLVIIFVSLKRILIN